MIAVIICNVIKVICLLFAVTRKGFLPLVTLGDGLASFLAKPDKHTQNMGPLSASDVRASERLSQTLRTRIRHHQILSISQENSTSYADRERITSIQKLLPSTEEAWKNEKLRWFSGASKRRWTPTFTV